MRKPIFETLYFGMLFLLLIYVFISVLITVLFPEIFFRTLQTLESYGLLSVLSIVIASLIAIYIHYNEKEEWHKKGKKEQNKLIAWLLAELKIISSDCFETYFKTAKGNLEWYEEEIKKGNLEALDHDINKLSFQEYITKLDSNICKSLHFEKLVRSLSYLNDKIVQINFYTAKLKMKGKNTVLNKTHVLELIKESKDGVKNITEKLLEQQERIK